MRKFDNEGGKLITYETIPEYMKMINRPRVTGRDNASESGSKSFTGTNSLDEALGLMRAGDKESLEQMKPIKNNIDKEYETQPSEKRIIYESPTGYAPIVPNAILGLPNSMRNEKRIKRDSKIINIFFNQSWGAMIPTSVIEYNGAFVLSYIDALERNNYRVNLYVGKMSSATLGVEGHMARIKKDSEPLNMYQTAFYLINPSYLRRVAFKIDENEEFLSDQTWSGYGGATGYGQMRKMIRESMEDEQIICLDSSTGIRPEKDFEENFELIQKEFKKTVYN